MHQACQRQTRVITHRDLVGERTKCVATRFNERIAAYVILRLSLFDLTTARSSRSVLRLGRGGAACALRDLQLRNSPQIFPAPPRAPTTAGVGKCRLARGVYRANRRAGRPRSAATFAYSGVHPTGPSSRRPVQEITGFPSVQSQGLSQADRIERDKGTVELAGQRQQARRDGC